MAIIGKIRSYSGLLIAVIGIALAAFVLGDFMGYGPSGSQNLEVGSVGSTKIVYPDFENRVAQATENWSNQTGNPNPSPREAFQIRQQVWDQILRERLLSQEFEELGIKISPDELSELIIGNDPHPVILQNFTNPDDGSFSSQRVIEFIQNLNSMEPSVQNQWFMMEDYIREQRKENKYHTLIRKGFYMPEALAKMDHQEKNTTASAQVMLKRFSQINDSVVEVSDRELRDIYNSHKHKYEREESRDLEYVVFPIFPSDEDRESIRREIEQLKTELEQTENTENFINANSDERFNPTYLSREELSPEIDSLMFNSEEGTVYGPFVENNAFVVAKLADIAFRPDSMKASHILISHIASRSAGERTTLNRTQAQAKADSLLAVVKRNPSSFAQLAVEVSEDPSAVTNQGDLGWFVDGAMVPGFNQAVLDNPVNSFAVAESEFGFHVIHITGKSTPTKKVQVARLTRNIEYSNRTFQRVYGEASAFSSTLRDNDDFDAVIEEQGLSKRVAPDIRPMDNSIPGIENPRGIIQWAFAERTEEGSISQIFDLDGRFVVARVANIKEGGIPEVEDIREDIMAIAIKEKKAQMIKEEMQQAQGSTLEEKAASLGLSVSTVENVSFNSNNLQGFGAEPAVVGAIFALSTNTLSEPIAGNAGVFMVEVTSKETAPEPASIAAQQDQLESSFRNRVPNEAFRALKESTEIEDNRHMFY